MSSIIVTPICLYDQLPRPVDWSSETPILKLPRAFSHPQRFQLPAFLEPLAMKTLPQKGQAGAIGTELSPVFLAWWELREVKLCKMLISVGPCRTLIRLIMPIRSNWRQMSGNNPDLGSCIDNGNTLPTPKLLAGLNCRSGDSNINNMQQSGRDGSWIACLGSRSASAAWLLSHQICRFDGNFARHYSHSH